MDVEQLKQDVRDGKIDLERLLNRLSRHWESDFNSLCNELMRLLPDRPLFVFATAAPVEMPSGESVLVGGTNSAAERALLLLPCTANKESHITRKKDKP